MLLIATDEAGYGPKLGPLVVAATAWELPGGFRDQEELHRCFAPLGVSVRCGELSLMVNDSKKLFHSRGNDPIAVLHAIVGVCRHWTATAELTLDRWLMEIASLDYNTFSKVAWLAEMEVDSLVEFEHAEPVIDHWKSGGANLVQTSARVITEKVFNQAIERGNNKSDLLSTTTLGLVASAIEQHAGKEFVEVFCDRHGGRQFYGAVLQHVWPEAMLSIVSETRQESLYELKFPERLMRIRFTVKGDSFVPVGLSSIHAKYLRECFMNSFNRYFSKHSIAGQTLRPTAGYPVDADRFLSDAAEIIERLKIEESKLIRCR